MTDHYHLAATGTVVANAIPCCPLCGSITARHEHDSRRCLRRECGHVAQFRIAAMPGKNGRVAFSTDGSDPAAIIHDARRKRVYSNRVAKP